jgi:hypothetical protein
MQPQAIHHLQGEVNVADREVKTLVEEYEQQRSTCLDFWHQRLCSPLRCRM